LDLNPSKIIAVHSNYPARARERGRMPTEPSYFLKPPSSLAASGDVVVRPAGCELLNFEGELAVIIGSSARNVSPEEAAAHIAGYSCSNDFGVYDMRWADRGSNLMAKGQDGYTPVGPVVAADVDPADMAIRTYVDGELMQDDNTGTMIWSPAELVADLSRFVTLEPDDIILTGTPANSLPVAPGQTVVVEIEGIGRLENQVVEGPELLPYGALPKVSPATRAMATGSAVKRVSDEAWAALKTVATATLTVQLTRRGIRNSFVQGLRPTRPDLRLLGYAHTLRYVPLREDVRDADKAEPNAQKTAVESIGPDEVLVMDARRDPGAGTIGDILAARCLARGATGIVTDGAIRDSAAIAALDIPTYYQAPHAAVLGLIHYPLESNVPIGCGGALVMPGDVIVGDGDGVLVVPIDMAEEVALAARAQEEREEFALERVKAGESVKGIYPLSDERRPDFEEWRKRKGDA
jgi:2-keto-4-pentenoate hydratase/2-oxohepta-3-ene-1,7-dioic acid hydratase in catechol pathway/regulator of RNase E activity RraA